jgi:hypothetical protein
MAATIARMPTWRCPHCGTPQTETARCWVCRRSSTACGTCRHFRRSVAAQLGYCGLDRRRAPLVGDEIRACWESTPVVAIEPAAVAIAGATGVTGTTDRPGRREFVEVDRAPASTRVAATTTPAQDGGPEIGDATPSPSVVSAAPAEPGWNLWGDLEA